MDHVNQFIKLRIHEFCPYRVQLFRRVVREGNRAEKQRHKHQIAAKRHSMVTLNFVIEQIGLTLG